MHNTTWLEFSPLALRHNLGVVRRLAPDAAILAMLKANGYGHGAEWVAKQLAPRAQGLAVARLNEAEQLRQYYAGRLLLLGNLLDTELLQRCADLQLDLVIHDVASAQLLAATALPRPLCVWLKLNVGMNRLGMTAEEFGRAHRLLQHHPHISGLHHMSHFSDAEDIDRAETERQIGRLNTTSEALGLVPRSMANSAAVIAHPASHGDWVRPGIMLYGDDPTASLQGDLALQPVMNFKSRVVALRTLEDGDGVGYNRRWRASGRRRLATVAAGYADGYPRHAPDGTPVLVNGQRASIAGRVSMDLLTVDVSELGVVQPGDEVTLWGAGLPAAEVGRHCGTISYELFTRVTDRVKRYYPDESA